MRNLTYAQTSDKFHELQEKLLEDEIWLKYENFKRHIQKVYLARSHMWAMYHRYENQLPTHATNTNNFVEASFRILKEIIFQRKKAYNLPELLDILFEAESRFYVRKLIDLANNRNICATSRYKDQTVSIERAQISKVEDGFYYVESESNPSTFYRICTASGTCECPQGRNRGPCKHKAAIHYYHGEAAFNVIPTQDPSSRRLWNFIATGQWLPGSWFRNFRDSQAPVPTQSLE